MSLNLDKSTWARVVFGDVVRNVNVTVRDLEAVGIDRVIAMEHMDPGEIKVQRWGSIEDGTTFTRRVTPGQTLFGKRRAYQRKVAFAEFDAICSGDILTFEADETHMLPKFLPFLVQSNAFFDHALSTSAGSLSPRTNWRDLSKYEFDLPPLEEQKRIADLLWAISRHDEGLQLRAAAATAALHQFLRDAFSEVGSSTAIVDLCTDVTGGVWGLPEGESDVDVLALGPRVYTLGTNDLVTDGSPVRSVSMRQAEFRVIQAGDIILERSGGSPTQPVGRVVIAGPNLSSCIPTDFQRLLRPDKSRVIPRFLFWRLRHDWAEGVTRNYSRTTTNITNLSVPDYLARGIGVPSLADQEHLLSQIGVFENAISSLARELASLATLRSSLLASTVGGN